MEVDKNFPTGKPENSQTFLCNYIGFWTLNPYTPAGDASPYTPAGDASPYTPAGDASPYTPAGDASPYTPAGDASPYTPAGDASPLNRPQREAAIAVRAPLTFRSRNRAVQYFLDKLMIWV